MTWWRKVASRPNVALILILGGSWIITLFAVWFTLYLTSVVGPAQAIAVQAISNALLLALGIMGGVLLVLALIILNIDRLSFNAGPVSMNLDRAEDPAVTVTTTVATKAEGAE